MSNNEYPTEIVRGFISEAHGDEYDFRPQTREITVKGEKSVVYEVNISQKWKDRDGNTGYHNIRVSVFGKAIDKIRPVVEKIRKKNAQLDEDEVGTPIAFEGEYQDPFTAKNGKVTHQFRAFDASPWLSAYRG